MPRDGSGPGEESDRPDPGQAATPETEGLAHSLSPVDLPDPPTPLPHGLGWTTGVIAWASLVLLLFNAHAIRGWAYQLPPSNASAMIVSAAEGWYDTVGRIGLNRPVEAMHGGWQAGRDMRFRKDAPAPDQPPPEASSSAG